MTKDILHDFDYDLDEEEIALLKAVENGEMQAVQNQKEEIALAKEIAKNTINAMQKRKPITIRLPEQDIIRLKAQALRDGLPYQTLISSVLHKFVEGHFSSRHDT